MGLDTEFGELLTAQPKPTSSEHSKSVTAMYLLRLRDHTSNRCGDLSQIFLKRRETGKVKYGTELMTFSGRDALVDAFQEALDLCLYLCQDLKEAEDQESQAALFNAERDLDTATDLLISLWTRLKDRIDPPQDRPALILP